MLFLHILLQSVIQCDINNLYLFRLVFLLQIIVGFLVPWLLKWKTIQEERNLH